MDQTTIHNTRELVLLATGAFSLIGVMGGIVFWVLKTKFMLRSECSLSQDKYHQQICKKIDEIRDILRANSISYNLEQQLLLRRSNVVDHNFQRIADKLNHIQPENPIELRDMPNPQ
jgi:hypothetical protein